MGRVSGVIVTGKLSVDYDDDLVRMINIDDSNINEVLVKFKDKLVRISIEELMIEL